MKRRKILSWLIWVFCVMINNCLCDVSSTFSSPSSPSINSNLAITKFQSALQQQNTFSILTSIEERLRNLDNIYSMQLSQNFESKLDQHNRRLENLDTKLMRLESIIMMNLGKISENISTKNFKDDMVKTDTLRKLDSIYEGLTHRLNYIERKLESNHAKVLEKIDETMAHLDRIEKVSTKRDSDLETELSAVMSTLEDLKKTYKNTEDKVLNATEENLNVSKHAFNLVTKYNSDTRKSMNKLHDNLVANLQYIDNRTTQHLKISDDTNIVLKQMKIELKEDFNNYANKVADMNTDVWKNTETTEDDLKNIAVVVNSTKIDLQNGVRSLMIQIGKLSQKENDPSSDGDHKEFEQKMNANIDKILTNQDVFLESCHRLQMDESQIESEISVMLNKLIDMLEKKLASEVKDIKNFEKNLKNHDNRIVRNLLQANKNVVSLYERTTTNTQMLTTEIRKIGSDLNALFAFVQSTTNEGSTASSTMASKMIMDKLNGIETCTRNLHDIMLDQKMENVSNNQIYKEVFKLSKSLSSVIEKIENYTRDINLNQNNAVQMFKSNASVPNINNTVRDTIEKIFGQNPKLKKNCKSNVRNLIDIRYDTNNADCIETPPTVKVNQDINNNQNNANKTFGDLKLKSNASVATPEARQDINDTVKDAIEKIFGQNPKLKKNCKSNVRNLIDIRYDANNPDCIETPPTVKNNQTNPKLKKNCNDCVETPQTNNPHKTTPKPKKKCNKNIRNMIDIRADVNSDCVETQKTTKKPIRRKMKYDFDIRADLASRLNIDDDYEDNEETTTITPTTTNVYEDNVTQPQ